MSKYRVSTPFVFWHILEIEADDESEAVDKAGDIDQPYAEGFGRGLCVTQGGIDFSGEPAIGGGTLDVEVEEIK